jgi:hypothetical protein
MMLFVAFADVLSVPLFVFVFCSGFRTRQVINRLRNSKGGYGLIILEEFMEILVVFCDVVAFVFVLSLFVSAPAMLAQLYDAFLLRSPTTARAAVRSNARSTIEDVAGSGLAMLFRPNRSLSPRRRASENERNRSPTPGAPAEGGDAGARGGDPQRTATCDSGGGGGWVAGVCCFSDRIKA